MWPWLQSILSVDDSGFWLHSIMFFQKKEFDKSSRLWELFPARFDFKISCFAEKQGIFISERNDHHLSAYFGTLITQL